MRKIQEIYPQLLTHKAAEIAIVPHAKPDADALGASVAWAWFWQKFGHRARIVSPTNWGASLNFLLEKIEVIDFSLDSTRGQELLVHADYLFALDWNSWNRVLTIQNLYPQIRAKKILLDHHRHPELSTFDYGLSLPEHSSTSEIILDQILELRPEFLDTQIASAIYAGIVGDTGSFRFAATSAELHEKVAILLRQNIRHTQIHRQLFDTNTPMQLRFLGHILTNRLELRYADKVGLIWVTQGDIADYEIKTGETELVISTLMSLQNLEIGVVLTDRVNEIRLSLRSRSELYDMSEFARKYFSGGGHKMAAGGSSKLSLERTIAHLWQCLQLEFTKLIDN